MKKNNGAQLVLKNPQVEWEEKYPNIYQLKPTCFKCETELVLIEIESKEMIQCDKCNIECSDLRFNCNMDDIDICYKCANSSNDLI